MPFYYRYLYNRAFSHSVRFRVSYPFGGQCVHMYNAGQSLELVHGTREREEGGQRSTTIKHKYCDMTGIGHQTTDQKDHHKTESAKTTT